MCDTLPEVFYSHGYLCGLMNERMKKLIAYTSVITNFLGTIVVCYFKEIKEKYFEILNFGDFHSANFLA
jgi:hypothetical protein